jgi:hypothetical protein
MKAWTEVVRRVGHEDFDGHFLSVCPGPDAPEMLVLLHSDGEKNAKFFGQIYLQASPDYMRALGEAIIACANDVGAKK